MDQRNPYNNPHFRNEVQRPDAPEPTNRMQTAVNHLTDPRVPHIRQQQRGRATMFFAPRGSMAHDAEGQMLSFAFGQDVLEPPQPRQPQGGKLGTFWQELDNDTYKRTK